MKDDDFWKNVWPLKPEENNLYTELINLKDTVFVDQVLLKANKGIVPNSIGKGLGLTYDDDYRETNFNRQIPDKDYVDTSWRHSQIPKGTWREYRYDQTR